MANDNINYRGSTDNTSSASLGTYTPSNLLRTTTGLRNELISRNLYTPNRIYPITDKSQLQNVLNAVGGVISLIAPFKAYDLSNTFYGRLIENQTPLTEIGLAMLGNQFALNAASQMAKDTFPTMNLSVSNIVNTVQGKVIFLVRLHIMK